MMQANTSYHKDASRKLWELINTYSILARYKINTEKSVAFPYTNIQHAEEEIGETIWLINSIYTKIEWL